MAAATPQEASAYRALVEDAKFQFGHGLVDAGLASLEGSGGNLVALVYQVALHGGDLEDYLEEQRQALLKLENRYLPWALAGKREDGTPYDAATLFPMAYRDIVVRVQQLTGAAWDSSLLAAVGVSHETVAAAQQAAATAAGAVGTAAAHAAKEALAPFVPSSETTDRLVFWLKVAAGTALVVALAGAAAKVVGAAETVRGVRA